MLERPDEGTVRFDGIDPYSLRGKDLLNFRRRVQMVFQDPTAALNPRQTIYESVAEGLRIHGIHRSEDNSLSEEEMVARALSRAGLRPPERFFLLYPHEISGGQRQRVVIAGALVLEPEMIVADEPVSSLDASVKGEILSLLLQLRDDLGIAVLVVTHDLGLAWSIADRVAVMYLGHVVELAPVERLYNEPIMPYTQALLSAVPAPEPGVKRERILLAGDVPSPANPPSGCVFHPRCQHPARDAACAKLVPPLEEKAPGHWAACIKQPPTTVSWEQQRAAGGTNPPEFFLPRAALHRSA